MGIVRPVMKEFPMAWLLFVPFIIFVTYTVMNLFIGILVTAISEIQTAKKEQDLKEEEPGSIEEQILSELQKMRSEIKELKAENTDLKSILKNINSK